MKIDGKEKLTIIELLEKIVNEDYNFSNTEKDDANYIRLKLKGLVE